MAIGLMERKSNMFGLSVGDYCTFYGYAGQYSLVKILSFECDGEYNGYVLVKFLNGNQCYVRETQLSKF